MNIKGQRRKSSLSVIRDSTVTDFIQCIECEYSKNCRLVYQTGAAIFVSYCFLLCIRD